MIELNLLKQLIAFAETGTLSAAAIKLHTSQPALTRSMKKLEEEAGIPLFVRGKNYLKLTDTGNLAASGARNVLKEAEYFEEKLRSYYRSLNTITIGFCAPIPQLVLTPIINSIFEGFTLSADMKDDADFLDKLIDKTYQLAVTHSVPDSEQFFWKKCGHEDLFISVAPSDPLTFYPTVRLDNLGGRSILLLTKIGFWKNYTTSDKADIHYLLQIDNDTFNELALHSDYPCFNSSYYIKRRQLIPGRIDIPLSDPKCHTDYYLVCLKSEKERFLPLFNIIKDNTVS